MKPALQRSLPDAAQTLLEYAGVLLLAAPFYVLTVRNYLRIDFWFDEVLSLNDFILVPTLTTVTDYRYPNNHVFFNLLTNLALHRLGVHNIFRLMDRPWIVRSLMLAISTLALVALYAVGKRFFGRRAGAAAVVILATTIPFYNFAVQVRGYALSVLLLSILLYFVWGIEEHPTVGRALGAVTVSALLMYTIPLNLYVLAAMMTCQAVFGALQVVGRKSGAETRIGSWRAHVTVIACLAGGVGVSVLLYLPILDHVLHNPTVAPSLDFNPQILLQLMPHTFVHFLSGRTALLLALPVGIAAMVRQVRKSGDQTVLKRYLLLFGMLVLPFLFSFIRRDWPYDRVFVNLVPVAALFLALNLDLALGLAGRARPKLVILAALAILVYCGIRFVGEERQKDSFLREQISAPTHEKKTYTIYEAFFQERYEPNEIARLTADFLARARRPLPVFLAAELDKQAFPRLYLQKYGIAFRDVCRSEPRDYPDFTEALLIATHPRAFETAIREQLPGTRCLRVNPEVMFSNLYYCRKDGT